MSAVSPDLPRLLLAPMEGLLDARLRAVVTQAARYDWCVTEFIRVTGTVLPARCYTRVAPELLNASCTSAGVPVRVQLLGSDPACLADNAHELAQLDPAGIDLNFGCPAPTVNRHRGGAVLLDEPELLHDIVSAVSRAVAILRALGRSAEPMGVKALADQLELVPSTCLHILRVLVAGGAQMIVGHARTKQDG